jgi:exonuclease III
MDLLQWNVSGLCMVLSDLQAVIYHQIPAILCLQETYEHPTNMLDIHGFLAYHYDHFDGDSQ